MNVENAVLEALGLQIQAMLVERKAVERVLGCDADETVLDAAVRVAEDLANTEKQIDDVRDILKAKVGELTVDAATHAIVLAQNHATLVKQVEQMERMLKEKDKENAEFKTCWHEMGVILGCIVQVLLLPPGNGDAEVRSWEAPGGPELMLEAARRVVKERDEARRDLASAREASASWQKERDDARLRLKNEREHSTVSDRHLVDTHKALGGRTGVEHVTEAAKRVVAERDAYRTRVKDLESNVCKLSAERDEAKALAVTLAKERDDARALCVAVAAEINALPDEPVLAAAKRVAQDLRDEVDEARQARRDRDKALAELNAVRRILPPMNDRETTVDAAKRVAERRDEARADAGRMMNDVLNVLKATFGETAVDAARRVVAAHAVVDAAREAQRTARVVSQTQEAISDLEQKASERATAAILEALGARAGEKAIDVAKRVVKERDELRDELDKRMSL